MTSSIVCPLCQTLYHAESNYCPVCSNPNRNMNMTESLKITNTQGYILNVGESTFDYKHILRLHIAGKKLDCNFEKYLWMGRETILTEPHIDFTEFHGLEAGVSRRHARLIRHPFSLICQDLNSTNGTFINGEKLDPNKPTLLRDGDTLVLGTLKIQVQFILDKKKSNLE